MTESDTQNNKDKVYKSRDLVSYRNLDGFSKTQLDDEMKRVYEATRIEREWCRDLTLFKTDADILTAAQDGLLERVIPTVGILPIQRLLDYQEDRANAKHKYHYSPPFLQPNAWDVAEFIGRAWSSVQRDERGEPLLFLALTSATRSLQYQQGLTHREESRIAIDATGDDDSSHEYGWAFDIDGSGLYRYDPVQRHVQSINPRTSNFDNEAELVDSARKDLTGVLHYLKERDVINFVEEVPGTKEWCFHICVNPHSNSKL